MTCTCAICCPCVGWPTCCPGWRGSTSGWSSVSGPGSRERTQSLLGPIVSDPLATVVRPAPLSSEAAARLLRERLSPAADDAFCAACHQETGGNPLLLRELVHVITAEGLAPTEEHVPRLRELAARAGSRTLSVRLSRLPAVLGDEALPAADVALAWVDVLRPKPTYRKLDVSSRAQLPGALVEPARA